MTSNGSAQAQTEPPDCSRSIRPYAAMTDEAEIPEGSHITANTFDITAWVRRSRAAQGLPTTVQEESVRSTLLTLMAPARSTTSTRGHAA